MKIKDHEFTLLLLIFEHKVYDFLLGLDNVKIADLGILPNRNASMFRNANESIKSDYESEDEIASEKLYNEELLISSMLEATEDHNAPKDKNLRQKLIQEVSATCYIE